MLFKVNVTICQSIQVVCGYPNEQTVAGGQSVTSTSDSFRELNCLREGRKITVSYFEMCYFSGIYISHQIVFHVSKGLSFNS